MARTVRRTDVPADFPQLAELAERGLARRRRRTGYALTDEGLAHGDAIGPWLVSAAVRTAMAEYALR